MTNDYTERDLETGLVEHVTKFLLELGTGFAYMGRQVPLHVGSREFFLDLLFYHVHLNCYLVIELKTGDFEPAHAGQLNFYVKVVDEQLRKDGYRPVSGWMPEWGMEIWEACTASLARACLFGTVRSVMP